MKRKLKILIPALLCTLYTSAQAQDSGVALRTEPDQNPSGFYIGTQANSPLFWGDLFSFGEKTHFGYGGGIFAGYKLGGWFSPELSFDYGVGRIGAQNHQLIDYVSKSGIINYVQLDPSDIKLGDLYSRTTYIQAGLRLQVGLISLFSPRKYHAFDVELAPAIYAQKFSPKLYTVAGNKQWSEGTGGGDWNYAAGGDLGLRFRLSPKISTHLRGGLLWLRNESFDGLNNDPIWRVNLMANASVGITFNFGNSSERKVAVPIVDTPLPPALDDSAERAETERLEREQAAREAEARRQAELEATRLAYIHEVEGVPIPVLYFRRGYAVIDTERYWTELDEILRVLNKYSDAQIRIEGWCDVTGTKAVNESLSQRRAEALQRYLVEQGIAPGRFAQVQGMGVDSEGGYGQTARRAQIRLSVR